MTVLVENLKMETMVFFNILFSFFFLSLFKTSSPLTFSLQVNGATPDPETDAFWKRLDSFFGIFTSVFKLFSPFFFYKEGAFLQKIISAFDAEELSLSEQKTLVLRRKKTKKDIKFMSGSLFQLWSKRKFLC